MTKNNHTIRYFIEIQPTGYYFFGNERTFTTAETDKYGETVANYLAESNDYPQQTAILGMLRYALLALYNKLDAPNPDKQKIIGANNFDIATNNTFGLIDKVSPLVIYNKADNLFLLPAGFDNQHYPKTSNTHLGYSSSENSTYMNENKAILPNLAGFEYKEDVNLLWRDNNGKIYKGSEIFKEITKVGVDKEKQKDAFYKQTFKGLEKGFSFGVWVDFEPSIEVSKLTTIFVPFGADQGLFKLTFHANTTCIFAESNVSSPNKILLLSDAWVEEKDFSQFDFGITQYADFRFINSKTSNYHQIGKGDKTRKYVLLKRGSVLYPNNHFNINSLNKANFQTIGYNYFQTF